MSLGLVIGMSVIVILAVFGMIVADNSRTNGEKAAGSIVLMCLVGMLWAFWGYDKGRISAFKQLGFKEVTKTVTTVEPVKEAKDANVK